MRTTTCLAYVLLAVSAGTVLADRVMEQYRIPENVRPTHYNLKILTSLSDDFAYHGQVWIDVICKTETDKIVLHSKNLNILENETRLVEVNEDRPKRDIRFAQLRRLAMREKKSNEKSSEQTNEGPRKGILGFLPKGEEKDKKKDEENDKFLQSDSEKEVNKVLPFLPHEEDEEGKEEQQQAKKESVSTEPPPLIAETTEKIKSTTQQHKAAETEPDSTEATLPEPSESPEEQPTSPAPTANPTESTTANPSTSAPNTEPQTSTEAAEPPSPPTPAATTSTTVQTASTTVPTTSTTPQLTTEQPKEDDYEVELHDLDAEKDFLIIHLSRMLQPGRTYRLYLKYQGFLTDTLTGFHRVAYGRKSSKRTTWLASTVFEPLEARTAFPCFDEPEYKATFDVSLGHEKKYTALSNMPLKESKPIEGKPDWQCDTFETTPKMSPYLVAFLISDLDHLTPRQKENSTETSNTTYRFWARHDVVQKTRYAMKIVPDMKDHLENLFGVKDPLPKHDFLALPSFISSALENWGLVAFSERNLLYTPGYSSLFSKFETTQMLGHEVAHNWFGNSVTPKWWDQIWLSEGFANFFEVVAADYVQPSWDVKSIALVYSYLRVYSLDGMHSTHPLVPQVERPSDLNEIFDSITYQKGYYMIRMINMTLGEETFMKGVSKYLQKFKLSNVEEEDLWEVLTEQAHHDKTLPEEYHLKDLMRSWTREAGYPVLDVTRDYENGSAIVTQRRFLRPKEDYELRNKYVGKNDSGSNAETRWYVPLTYTTKPEMKFDDTKPRVWLKPQDEETVLSDMPGADDFVLMNLQVAGLYRVNYDERNWGLLIDHLLSENYSSISVINRVQILDDLLDFAKAGEIPYKKALDATSYLKKESHYLPWKAALSNFEYISRMFRSTDSNKSFKKFMRNLIAPRFEKIGFEPKKNESLYDGLSRKQVVKWACGTGLRQCTRKSISLFRKWTEERKPDDHNPIPSNLRSVVYCTAIEHGGAKDWQFLWQRYLSNIIVTDKNAIVAGLGCSRNTRTLKKYLDWSLKESSGLKKQDSAAVFKSVANNDVGFNLAKDFLKERVEDIKKYMGNNQFHLPQLIESLAAKMNQPKHLEELDKLEEDHRTILREAPRALRQATERVQFNIGWLEQHYNSITEWLKQQKA